MSFKGFTVLSSGGHFLQRNETIFANFGRWSPKEHFCENMLKSAIDQGEDAVLVKCFSTFYSGDRFVQQSRTV